MKAWQNIETAEQEFLTNLAENGGLDPKVAGMLRHCANYIAGVALDPQLAAFYDVDSVPALLTAMEEHIEKLQDSARRNVKPWEDTFPPTLLPKYLRDNGLPEPAAPGVVHIHTHTTANPPGDQRQEGDSIGLRMMDFVRHAPRTERDHPELPDAFTREEAASPPTEAAALDYVDIANRAQEATGRSVWPSTVKAVLEAAALSPTASAAREGSDHG